MLRFYVISETLSTFKLFFLFTIFVLTLISIGFTHTSALTTPTIIDAKLKVEVVFKGLKFPTSMAFLGPNDILVLEKNNGTVQRIVNGKMLPEPLLDVNVASQSERGMLGIAVANQNNTNGGPTNVFLYYTETQTKDGEDASEKKDPLGNRLYRYELVNNKLVNPKMLLDLPSTKPLHNGGKLVIGPDNNVYLVIGDLDSGDRTKAHNNKNGTDPDGTSAIYRITQDGEAVEPSIFEGKEPLNKYYAYGIRNSFGLDFDPVTGNLWDTENGPAFGDEINLVKRGFNSGWGKVQGIWEPSPSDPTRIGEVASPNHEGLVNFHGKGKYSPPEFTWNHTVGITSLKFLNSDKLGKQYENDLFVGGFHKGYLYHFDLNKKRNELRLDGPLHDKVAYNRTELQDVTFGQGLGGITDIEVGPDGYLYILSLQEGGANCEAGLSSFDCIQYSSPIVGTIYKIVPAS
jgi:glucose/arabinose dehydrogenase